ncbi:hypothetical protein DM02DRAFT_695026 [Periconia macrospinosa]|uniref:Rhodopsin domain-containing protein n=1 Tax=Periconia macrospinosa TaxID=97972 RepID=A0A2V1E071_9PLEO|nr:hypothetical protein DM02DRAFT_695026 [Periconia macrospinosa]
MAAPLNPPPNLPPNDSIALRLLIPVGIIIGIGLPIYVARMYSRLRKNKKLSCDDYAITLAEICSIAGYTLVALSCKYGLGRHTIHVSPRDRYNALFYFSLQAIVWYFGVAGMKISVACMLLRMQRSATWKWILWIVISVQVIINVVAVIRSFTICTPIRAIWESVPNAKCVSTHGARAFAYAYISTSIISDLFLSLMPLTFIYRLHRPKFERVVVGILMCLGLIATATAIIRMTNMVYQNRFGDRLRNQLILAMWCMLEEVLGVTAASIPYLKSPTERMLRHLGLLHFTGMHELSPEQMGLPSFRIPVTDHALESGNVRDEIGSSSSGKPEFELAESSRTASQSQ